MAMSTYEIDTGWAMDYIDGIDAESYAVNLWIVAWSERLPKLFLHRIQVGINLLMQILWNIPKLRIVRRHVEESPQEPLSHVVLLDRLDGSSFEPSFEERPRVLHRVESLLEKILSLGLGQTIVLADLSCQSSTMNSRRYDLPLGRP